MTTSHEISNEFQRGHAILSLTNLDLDKPWVMTLKPYSDDRSDGFNKLSHVWYSQVAATEREYTAAQVKGFCKLHFGVPILRADPDFSEVYDAVIKPLSYEKKIMIMSHPDMFPVTSLMTNEQFGLYMTELQQHYAGRVDLRFPNEPPSL